MSHPLLYLALKQAKNGLLRALRSPRRLLGVLFLFGYYALVFRPFGDGGSGPNPIAPLLHLPRVETLNTLAFGLFLALTLVFLLTLAQYRGGHRMADVDVLFATPVSPRQVMLFRMLRESLLNLLLPMFLVLIAWRPTTGAWSMLVEGISPQAASLTGRLASLSYFLMAATWVAAGYALSLWINRPTATMDRWRKWIGGACVALVVGAVASVSVMARHQPGPEGFVAALQSPILRAIFFLPDAAAALATAPLTGDWVRGSVSGLILVGSLFGACFLALRQADWLYEIAAQRVSSTVQTANLARKGDTMGVLAEMARTGRLKPKGAGWFNRWSPTGATALIWKDLVTQARGLTLLLLLFPLIGSTMVVAVGLTARADVEHLGRFFTVLLLAMTFATASTTAQSGFIDLLNRVDTLKPLPFSPTKSFFFEVAGKAAAGWVCATVICLVGLVVKPAEALNTVGGFLLSLGLALLVASCIGLTTVLFPDVEDASQRGFRGLVLSLALLILTSPPIGLYLGLHLGLGWAAPLAALPTLGLFIGLSVLAAAMAGRLFADYNPSD